jgi:glucose/mannose transport system permease protein
VLSKWRFSGSELLFALLLFGVFMPMQVVLLPMSQVLGWLGIASSVWGLMLVHVVAGMAGTTLFFRNYYVGLPDELVKAARWTAPASGDLLAHRAAAVHADHGGHADLAVHQHLERLPLRRGVLRRRQQAHHRGPEQPGQHHQQRQGIQRGHGRGHDRRLPTLLVYVLAGKYFVRGLTAGAVKG